MALRCPYCLDDLLPQDAAVRCEVCRTPHHQACFREHEGCTSIGCAGVGAIDAGPSLYLRPALRLGQGEAIPQHPLGPFRLIWRRLQFVPRSLDGWQARQEQPWCRLQLHATEVREGAVLGGRASLFLPVAARLRRLELRLSQGIARPQLVARVSLIGRKRWLAAPAMLPAGLHPFELELRAPPITPHVDPFVCELVGTQSALQERLVSERQVLFLLQRAIAPVADGPPAMIRPPIRPAAPPPLMHPAGPGGSAGLGGGAFVAPGRADPFAPAPASVPLARTGGELPAAGIFPLAQAPAAAPAAAADPFDPFAGGSSRDGWRLLPLRARDNGVAPRSIAARYLGLAAGGELTLSAPDRLTARELAVTISGGAPLLSLTLAVVTELVRPGGQAVAAPGLPTTEEVRLLGHEGLEAGRYGPESLELRLEVAPEHLQALERARADGAHNAALRFKLALDGLGADGRVRASATRTVTVVS